jgi:MFS-type transporter involved in bile tolerance (Atg22 family)
MIRISLMMLLAAILVASAFGGGYAVSRTLFPPALPPDGGATE